MAAYVDIDKEDEIAIVARLPRQVPNSGQSWKDYREKSLAQLERIQAQLDIPTDSEVLIAANSLQIRVAPDQIRALSKSDIDIELLELDPLLPLALMNEVPADIGLGDFRLQHPDSAGHGVTVAVLDSGIDTEHPALDVASSISVCGEPVELPGEHGTHCAGSIASKDAVFRGVAPAVSLLNIKVLSADGNGHPGDVARGVDAALDGGAEVLSLSVGSNHLPVDSDRGHGWTCTNGDCQLCLAIDTAATLDGSVAIVAAGNEHQRAESLRAQGRGAEFDTELDCPGQAREALTVGAITKQTWREAGFSSRGPTAYGTSKPDLVAPGVNITSTVPVPRDAGGNPDSAAPRARLFGRLSGTSMATPIVAGLAALVVEDYKAQGIHPTPAEVRSRLLAATAPLVPIDPNGTGAGRARAG